MWAGNCPAGEQLCRKGPGSPGAHQVERGPAGLEEREVNGILGCIRQKHYHEAGGNPTIYSALAKPHLEFCVQFQPPQLKRNMDILETFQQKAKKIGTEASLT